MITDNKMKIIVGGLLHDTGKVLYRADDQRNHSESGYDFIKNETDMNDQDVLDQIRYHHGRQLKGAKLRKDSPAYITYIADNIAAAMDRREKKEGGESGFVREMPLDTVFNILNGNQEKKVYNPSMLDAMGEINYPTDKVNKYSESFYLEVKNRIRNCLNGFEWKEEYMNSLLSVLEATLTYVPSSTSKKELADISLYDHQKMTAALGSCIYDYLKEQDISDYEDCLVKHATDFYGCKAFLLYSMDISGIQKFIYTITREGALKGLRSRSFYLEIVMEHLVDELLTEVGLSRANLIYSGGGHAYMLLANTQETKEKISRFEETTNNWFLDHFQTALYIAGGMAECSSNELRNEPNGSYRELFRTISAGISEKKMKRYTPKQILALNAQSKTAGTRECRVCGRSDHLTDDNICEICSSLEKMSYSVLHGDFFTVTKKKEKESLPLPNDCYLIADTENHLRKRMEKDDCYVRAYSKNRLSIGHSIATNLWVGDYANGDTFEDLASASCSSGFQRLAVMRADVDNLGQAFVRGFEQKGKDQSYVTLSRTATFSRKLSMFFKYHINSVLENGTYMITDEDGRKRNIVIVYSGGDDVFLVGSWDDVIGFAIDLYDSLKEYAQSSLTISAGIGLYPDKYPISVMAEETGWLEDAAKGLENKNGVALFGKDFTFHWDAFIEKILEEKLLMLKDYFGAYNEKGNAFLYQMLELIRERKERINIARYAYILGRIAPEKKKNPSEQELKRQEIYSEFSEKMYRWIKNDEDARELEMAIYLYVYMNRNKEDK